MLIVEPEAIELDLQRMMETFHRCQYYQIALSLRVNIALLMIK